MKKILLFLTLPLLAISFNSCSKDGDENGGDSYQWPKYDRLVKTINWQDEDGCIDKCTFTYDNQQRLTKVAWNEEYFMLFTYNGNKISINEDGEYYTTYTLDKNGYLTRQDDEDGSYALHQYSNGYASKSTEENNSENDHETVYTWANGNLVKTVEKSVDEYGTENYGYSWTYNNVENKLNINIFDILDSFWWDPAYIKFKGRYPKNYPITIAESDGETMTLSYTFDNDGYPTKIVETWTDGSDTSTSTYIITYY